jgi:hypothetical protein
VFVNAQGGSGWDMTFTDEGIAIANALWPWRKFMHGCLQANESLLT